MIIGLLMLLTPAAIFVATWPLSARLKPTLRKVYRIVGGTAVLLGSATSIYFAAYTGDQGGIAAFFFQILVILFYAGLSVVVVILNWYLGSQRSRDSEG